MNIVILGAGISGLMAAHQLGNKHKVTVIEAGNGVGGNFTSGGLKYIHASREMMDLMDTIGLQFQSYAPMGGLWRGMYEVVPWPPGPNSDMHQRELEMYQRIHWLRTRGYMPNHIEMRTCMNDPFTPSAHGGALSCDHDKLIERLKVRCDSAGVTFAFNNKAKRIVSGSVECEDGWRFPFDVLITTLPLPVMMKIMNPWVDDAKPKHNWLVVGKLTRLPAGLLENHRQGISGSFKWDYVYTPLDPIVTRMSRGRDGWDVEAPYFGGMPPDVDAFAKHGWSVSNIGVIPGHLVPLTKPFQWPSKVVPIGRFATWDSRQTADRVLRSINAIAEKL